MRLIFIIVGILFFFWMQEYTNYSDWESASVSLLIYYILQFLDDLGKKLVILDLTIIIGIFTCLVMPAYFYHNYQRSNIMAATWVKYMFIESDVFYSYAFPAILAMIAGMKIPILRKAGYINFREHLKKLELHLKGKASQGFILIGIGIVSGFIYLVVPKSIEQILYLAKQLVYVGMFYIYFSDYPRKMLVLLVSFLLTSVSAIASGMFGEMIYVFSLSLIFILLNFKLRFIPKLTFFILGSFLVLVLQYVKVDYRKSAWKGGNSGSLYFIELFAATVYSPESMFADRQLFKTAVRLNQGWFVARTIYHVPRQFSYADGETIWKSVAATVVPRVLWPDKPMSSGRENLKRFWGYVPPGSTSMNIGPMGEGYANFGTVGGVVFMFFYGLFFNFALKWLLLKSYTRITLICWLPFLFLYTIGLETDIMTTMNSLVKGIIFMIFVNWAFSKFLNIKL